MAEEPTQQQKAGTADTFRNISNLLKGGLFPGVAAADVATAINWLEAGVSFLGTIEAPKEEEKPDLTAVPDEQN